MTDEPRKPFLSRWSQRKLAASREAAERAEPAAVVAPAAPVATAATPAPPESPEAAGPQLPPVDSLSFESDFTPFLQPKVDESLRRQALRKLFADPHFNVMDGLDVYIDDYGKTVPITPEILAQLNHAKFLFDPPKTRINAQGHVEDVPPEPAVVADAAADDPTQDPTRPSPQMDDDAARADREATGSEPPALPQDAQPSHADVVATPRKERTS